MTRRAGFEDTPLGGLQVGTRQSLARIPHIYSMGGYVHGHTVPRDGFGEVKPWAVNLAECDYHVCSRNRRGEVWDKFSGYLTYCGKSQSEAEAISIWKDYLLSIGVHAENAAVLRND